MKRTLGIGLGGLVLAVCFLTLPAGAANAAEAAPGEDAATPEAPYVVKKGDTLWGISRDLLADPLLWRRLWEENKFIVDPNKIYPGDRLSLPGKEIAPGPEAPAPPAPVAEAPKPEPPTEKAEAPPEAPAPPAPVAEAPKPEPPIPPASAYARVCSPVLIAETEPAPEGVGELVKSIDNRVMVSAEDRVMVGLDAPGSLRTGDTLAAIRTGRRIVNPRTGALAGRVVYVLGLLEVTDVKDRVARARVSYSCGPMGIGDRVTPFTPTAFPEDKTPQPAQRTVSAAILDSLRGEALMGQQQIAFVDVGANQGIAPGDIFALLRPNRPVVTRAGTTLPLPSDRLGDAVVIRVAGGSATLLLTASSREVRVGDQAVLSYQITP